MKISAGVIVVFNNKILMAHATKASWFHTYTPPKGGVEEGENLSQAACREFMEEVGIKVNPAKFEEKIEVVYKDKQGHSYKTVYLFVYRINSLSEIGLSSEKVPSKQLQLEEVDEAIFMGEKTLRDKCLPRYLEILLLFTQNQK